MTNNTTLCDLLVATCKESKIEPTHSDPCLKALSPEGSSGSKSRSGFDQKSGHTNALVQLRQSALQPLHFTRADFLIIASLYQQYIEIERPISVVRLLRAVTGQNSSSLAHANQVLRLALDGILTLSKAGVSGLPLPIGMLHANHNMEEDILQGYDVSLSKPFLGFLIDEQRPVLIETGFESNREFLRDAFRCGDAAQRYFNVPEDQWRIDLFDVRVAERYQNLIIRLRLTEIEIPFRNLIREYDLSCNEQLALLHLVERESFRLTAEVGQVSRIIEPDQFHRDAIEAVQSPDGKLRKHGLIEAEQQRTLQGMKTMLSIEPGLFRYIVSDGTTQSKINSRDICRKNPAITISKPCRSIDHLILPDKEMELLTSVIQSCEADSQQILRKWGVIQANVVDSCAEEAQQTIILLYGQPGVGKTLAAEVIATELGKEFMRVDISQVQDKWVGESEKNLRSIFSSYNECLLKSSNPPILFLNECDQFLVGRIEQITHSTDQMLNTMQNMLLEFLEGFSGICIATTNLITNLDPAFSRRFTHKIGLPWPDPATRERLWNTLIPPALPMGANFNAQVLADEYSFSGSQIRTVIYNAAQEAANRQQELQVVEQSDLIRFAELEHSGSFDGSRVSRIGFD